MRNEAREAKLTKRQAIWAFLAGFITTALLVACYLFVVLWHGQRDREENYDSFRPASSARALPYREINIWDNCYSQPKQIAVKILLDGAVKSYTPDELAATCMASAKYYSAANNFIPAKIALFNSVPEARFSRYRLAECAYAPSGKGWKASQNENWTWNKVLVNPEERFSQPNEARRIDAEIYPKYGRDYHKRAEEIARLGNMDKKVAWDATWDGPKMLEADYQKLQDIQPETPLPPDPELLRQNDAEILQKSEDYFRQLEDFWAGSDPDDDKKKDWTKNRASNWNLEVETLWGDVRKFYPVSHQIMCLPWDIDTLEWYYMHGEKDKARKLRELILKRMGIAQGQNLPTK